MQYFIKVKFRRLLAVIGHCRAWIRYKIQKHCSTYTKTLVSNIAARACYIATQYTSYIFFQYNDPHHSHSLNLRVCKHYGVCFTINVCLLTYKDLPFTTFQRSPMFSVFSSAKQPHFVYIADELSNLLAQFASFPKARCVNEVWKACQPRPVHPDYEYNFWSRHRRYSACVVTEGDAFFLLNWSKSS